VPLRCWWALPSPPAAETGQWHENVTEKARNRAVIVLPEVFGVNGWVRSVADRIAAAGVPALAMPLFARSAPDLELLPQVRGQLTCLCGTADPLIPASDQTAIASALAAADPSAERLRLFALEGADHGFMCEARTSFDPVAAATGWRFLLEALQA